MTTKAQKQFSQIMSEIDLTKFSREVLEFKLISKSELTDIGRAFKGAHGGIKVVGSDNSAVIPNFVTTLFVLYDDNRIGAWSQTNNFYEIKDVNHLIEFINDPA